MTTFKFETPMVLEAYNLDRYAEVNAKSKEEREAAAKAIILESPPEVLLNVIKKLTHVCFEMAGPLFIRQGASNFLADILKNYIDKKDGESFSLAFKNKGKTAIEFFQFSPDTQAVLSLVFEIAIEKKQASQNQDYIDFLPANIANKIWQPILANRLPATLETMQKLQQFSSDTAMIKEILKNNIKILTHENPNQPPPQAECATLTLTPAEERYQQALAEFEHLLTTKITARDYQKGQALIKKVEGFRLDKSVELEKLTVCLLNTSQFLKVKMEQQHYLEQAYKMKKFGSIGLKIVGSIMITFALAVIASGFFLSSAPLNAPLLSASALVAAVGVSFLRGQRPKSEEINPRDNELSNAP